MDANRDPFVLAAATAGLAACAGEFVVPFVLARFYPGYSHLRNVLSELGAPGSPVATWMDLWWVTFGVLMVVFAFGFARAFAGAGPAVYVVAGQLVVFGLLAGIGSGLFPMDPAGSGPTLSGRLHNSLAGVGFLALIFVPLVSLAVFPRPESPGLYWLAVATQVAGLAALALYVAAQGPRSGAGFMSQVGLWQRVFLLVYYIHLSAIAITMLRRAGSAAVGEGA